MASQVTRRTQDFTDENGRELSAVKDQLPSLPVLPALPALPVIPSMPLNPSGILWGFIGRDRNIEAEFTDIDATMRAVNRDLNAQWIAQQTQWRENQGREEAAMLAQEAQ